jgi:hypothetical protein
MSAKFHRRFFAENRNSCNRVTDWVQPHLPIKVHATGWFDWLCGSVIPSFDGG